MEIATGKYVCFLDADDYYLDFSALELLIKACENHNVKVSGAFRKIYKTEENILENFELHRLICEGHPEGVELDFYQYQDDFHYQNYIFEKNIIVQNKIEFPAYRRYQDPPFFLKVMLIAKKFWILPIEFYCLRLGHQDFNRHRQWIEHTLLGMLENMKTGKEHELLDLQKKLVDRINQDFRDAIVEHFDDKILSILVEIQSNIINSNLQIMCLKDVTNYYQMKDTFYILKILLQMEQEGVSLADYLNHNMGLRNIAIYGLGYIGSVLFWKLQSTNINIVCGIDKSKKQFNGLKMFNNVQNTIKADECNAIIVTPVKCRQSLVKDLNKQTEITIYHIIDVLSEVEQMLGEKYLCVKYQ